MPEKFNPTNFESYEDLPEEEKIENDDHSVNSSEEVISVEKNIEEKIDIIPPTLKGIPSGLIEKIWGNLSYTIDHQKIIEELKKNEKDREIKKEKELNEKYVNLSEDGKREFSIAQKDAEKILLECVRRRDKRKIGKLLGEESFVLDELIINYINFKKNNPAKIFPLNFDRDIDHSVYNNLLKKLSFDILNNNERKEIRALNIIDDNRQISESYNILKSKQEKEGIYSRTSYSSAWNEIIKPDDYFDISKSPNLKEKIENELEYLREHLSGDILIDLGGGKELTILNLARKCGVQTYINVDNGDYNLKNYRFLKESEKEVDKKIDDEIKKSENIRKIYINDDLLDFVTNLKDGIASFSINGIDECIIGKQNFEYAEVLAKEIFRATRPGGIIFGDNSVVLKIFEQEIQKKRRENEYKLNRYAKHVNLGYDSHIFEKSKSD